MPIIIEDDGYLIQETGKILIESDFSTPLFTDSGVGSDIKLVNKINLFPEIGLGIDVIFKNGILILIDSGFGIDIFGLDLKIKNFIDLGICTDLFLKNAILVLMDSGIGSDVVLVNKIIKLAESCTGIDDFLLGGEMLFKDTGVGIETVSIVYPYPRHLKRTIIIIRGLK